MEALEALVVKAEIVSETKNKNESYVLVSFPLTYGDNWSKAENGIKIQNQALANIDKTKLYGIAPTHDCGWTGDEIFLVEAGKTPNLLGVVKEVEYEAAHGMHFKKYEDIRFIPFGMKTDDYGVLEKSSAELWQPLEAKALKLYNNFVKHCETVLPILKGE